MTSLETHKIRLHLEPCSKYLLGVSLGENVDDVSPPHNWLRVSTQYDSHKPVDNPRQMVRGSTVRFTWSPSCNINNQQPPYYVFRVRDVTLNVSHVDHIRNLWYNFDNVSLGAEYEFSVATPDDDAVPFVWKYTAPALPSPINVNFHCSTNQTFTFFWDLVHELQGTA